MTSTLAGCTGGDPDSGGEMDTDAINDLIDANLQDFINNTTITVNQEIHHHYYNNTTVYEGDSTNNAYNTEYNNTTVIDGGEVTNENYDQSTTYFNSSSSGGSILQLIDITFTLDDLLNVEEIDFRNNTFSYNYTYYDYLTNEDRNDTFSMSCSNFYLVGSGNSSSGIVSYWTDSSGYENAWDSIYNNTVRDLLGSIANDDWLREICDEDYYEGEDYHNNLLLHQIIVPEGLAMKCAYSSSSSYNTPVLAYFYWNDYSSSWDDYNNRYEPGAIVYPSGDSFYGQPFHISMNYLSTPWNCDDGYAGGSEDTSVSIQVSNIAAGYEYRLQLYYEFIPVNFVSPSDD